jgi:glutamyl-tRNA reductase
MEYFLSKIKNISFNHGCKVYQHLATSNHPKYMQLVICGINHNTAPVSIRENIAFNTEVLPTALNSLQQLDNVVETVVVSTCNRTEIYCHLNKDDDTVINWLHQFH